MERYFNTLLLEDIHFIQKLGIPSAEGMVFSAFVHYPKHGDTKINIAVKVHFTLN